MEQNAKNVQDIGDEEAAPNVKNVNGVDVEAAEVEEDDRVVDDHVDEGGRYYEDENDVGDEDVNEKDVVAVPSLWLLAPSLVPEAPDR